MSQPTFMIPFSFLFVFRWAFAFILVNVLLFVSICGIILFSTELKHFNSVFDTVVFVLQYCIQHNSCFEFCCIGNWSICWCRTNFLLVQFPNGWFIINICIHWSSLFDIVYMVNYEIGNIICQLKIFLFNSNVNDGIVIVVSVVFRI